MQIQNTTNENQQARNFWECVKSFVVSNARKESGPVLAGSALGFIFGPVGFVAGYAGLSAYRHMKSSESVHGRLVTFAIVLAASVAATTGLGDTAGAAGLMAGAVGTTLALSYVTGGLVKGAVRKFADALKLRAPEAAELELAPVLVTVPCAEEANAPITAVMDSVRTPAKRQIISPMNRQHHVQKLKNRRSVALRGRA